MLVQHPFVYDDRSSGHIVLSESFEEGGLVLYRHLSQENDPNQLEQHYRVHVRSLGVAGVYIVCAPPPITTKTTNPRAHKLNGLLFASLSCREGFTAFFPALTSLANFSFR